MTQLKIKNCHCQLWLIIVLAFCNIKDKTYSYQILFVYKWSSVNVSIIVNDLLYNPWLSDLYYAPILGEGCPDTNTSCGSIIEYGSVENGGLFNYGFFTCVSHHCLWGVKQHKFNKSMSKLIILCCAPTCFRANKNNNNFSAFSFLSQVLENYAYTQTFGESLFQFAK